MKKLRVEIGNGRGYNILIDYNFLEKIGTHIKSLNVGDRIFLITSPRIGKLYLDPLVKGLKKAGFKDNAINYVPDGERFKSFKSYEKLLKQIVTFNKTDDNKIFIVNLGGGVVGDLGGYVAATYKRGINYIQVPTTLLAFVDCGIGGKVGINFRAKNNVGAFHQPRLVCADLGLLKTLHKRELRSGLGEVVKYGVIHSLEFFEFIENNIDKIFALDKKVMEELSVSCYTIKADYVKKDEFDTKDIRVMLNYGHTIGHAVEEASRYAYRHGEALSIGIVCVNDIAVKLGLLDKGSAARIENLLIKIGLPVKIKNCELEDIMRYFWRDKKFVNGTNKLIFATEIGKTKIMEDVSEKTIRKVIQKRFGA